MNAKITIAICIVALLCLTSSTEGSKFKDALRRIGKATEKVGKKALEDGLVTAYLGSKIGKRSVDSVLQEAPIPEIGVWHNQPAVLLNRPEAGRSSEVESRRAPFYMVNTDEIQDAVA